MKLYLSRKRNGLYQLTKLEPVSMDIVGTGINDVFVQPGDPINFQGLCPFSVKALFGKDLALCGIERVNLFSEPLTSKRNDQKLKQPWWKKLLVWRRAAL